MAGQGTTWPHARHLTRWTGRRDGKAQRRRHSLGRAANFFFFSLSLIAAPAASQQEKRSVSWRNLRMSDVVLCRTGGADSTAGLRRVDGPILGATWHQWR